MNLEHDYELHSHGLASMGANAVDNLVSRSRPSSSSTPPPPQAHSTPSSSSTASATSRPLLPHVVAMGDQATKLQCTLDVLAATLQTLQASIEANT